MEKGIVYQSTTTTIPNKDMRPQSSAVKLRNNVMSDATASPDTVVSIDDQLNTLHHASEQLPPLVNSSLMFFSTRPISQSLNMLANSPHLYPRAMEILLRNWSGGGESLRHANIFLQEPACCQGLLGPNWKCWYGDDGTLFDLAYQNVAKSEQPPLFKALLRADIRFRPQLCSNSPVWAEGWRAAVEQSTWLNSKGIVAGLSVGNTLWGSMMTVLMEYHLDGSLRISYTQTADHRQQYMDVLRDSLDMGLDIASEYYDYDKMIAARRTIRSL
jgi:hypothetical protein